MDKIINVIGGGLAGSECAYQLAKYGYKVNLYEMKKHKKTPAQKIDLFAELVCSNSLKSNELTNACGLLKAELRQLDSLLMRCANECCVPAGSALSVDREKFADLVTKDLTQNSNINIIDEEFTYINIQTPTIIATGPLTSDKLCESIKGLIGCDFLSFYDASSPIIYADSIDMKKAYICDRYNKGEGDYLNCGMNKEEYIKFIQELTSAESVILKDFEKNVFESCMPIEVMAKRGLDSLRYGPLKPLGLDNPITNEKYYAVVQLRKENCEGSMYNMVGFQTNLTFPEQSRVFRSINGLKNAEFARYGVMHKNIFVNAPKVLNKYSQMKDFPNIFIAGQLSGVEGYVESIASGLACAINMHKYLSGKNMIDFTCKTMLGSLLNYISNTSPINFQPMNSNFAIVQSLDEIVKNKEQKRLKIAQRSLNEITKIKENI